MHDNITTKYSFLCRCTALHYSACYNFLDFIEEFVEIGASVNAVDNKGMINTCIHIY